MDANTEIYKTDLCVIGGGLSGICAAVAAARNGLQVVLIHDRPVLGGNASSEVKMWVRGASTAFPFYREGGIIEEIAMLNTFYNPTMSYAVWDSVLYGLVLEEPNITLILNASCNGAEEEDGFIKSVSAWQLTTYKNIRVKAVYFADCSGDCILSEFTDAPVMRGRESQKEYNESYAAETGDLYTMGNSCILQVRETEEAVPFIAPPFARKIDKSEFVHRMDINEREFFKKDNFWWLEIGGEQDTVKDAEKIKTELIATAYGVWDFIKNSGYFDSACWELDWVCFLSGKRESRRYKGAYVMTQKDVENPVAFFDEIAYGGWTMDDHNPLGFHTKERPNHHHRISKPYAIPFRCLYSESIKNLLFAGRNISVTHLALSSTRVMATCSLIGQAVGTACAVLKKYGLMPAQMGEKIGELKQTLRNDDCYLLHTKREVSPAIQNSVNTLSEAEFDILCNGTERKLCAEHEYVIHLAKNKPVKFEFESRKVSKLRIVFDNDISRETCNDNLFKVYPQRLNIPKRQERVYMPPYLTKHYKVWVKVKERWEKVVEEKANYKRLVYIPVNKEISGIMLMGYETYGSSDIRFFSIDVL